MTRVVVGLLAVVALLCAPASARADAVSDVSVDNTNPSAAASARTVYVVGFMTSPTGGLSAATSSRISVTLPAGTGFNGYTGSVLDGSTTIGGCGSATGSTVTCSLNFGVSVPADHRVTVRLAGVTNPPAATGLRAQVSTTSDAAPADSAPYSVVAGGPVTVVTVDNTRPTSAEGGRMVYTVGFTTSSTGGLSADAKSSVTVTLPTSTGFNGYTGSVLDGTTTIGGCGSATGSTVTCTLNFGSSVAPSHPISVRLAGVTNPAAATGLTAQVSTSSDTPTVDSSGYSVVSDQPVTEVTVDNTNPTSAAGGRTVYAVGFTTSSTGGLSSEAKSSIAVSLPAGTGFAGYTGSVVDGSITIGGCGSATGTTVTCTLNFGSSVPDGHEITVELAGVTNPAAGTGLTAQVSTTSDPATVGSAPYDVVPDHPPATPAVANADPTAAAGGRTLYMVDFTTSSTGGLSAGAKSSITLTFPAGTGFGGYTGSVLDGSTTIGGCGSATGTTVTCTLNFGGSVPAGHEITVELAGVTNPATGTGLTAQVSTSSDTSQVTSAAYGVVAAQAVGAPTVTLASSAASAITRYSIAVSTSSTGGLSADAKSAITVTFPTGTGLGGYTGSVLDGTTTIGGCGAATGQTITCTLNFGRSVPAGHAITVQADNVTNPASSAGNSVHVATTSDHGADSAPYSIGADTSAPQTNISSGPAGQTSAGSVTFTFGSSEPGSTFTCRLDGPAGAGTPAPCSSPKTYTSLTPGSYTFTVAATDPAGNPDPSPAAQTFAVASPVPAPTAQPTVTPSPTVTPAPTPVPRRSVVAAPVKGTVRVRLPGTNRFVDVDATRGVPVGSTVDTTHGTVRLTALQKAGGKPQTATFFAGVFKLTQTRKTTDLTLNEALAACPRRGHASAAAARKKRPKTRRLWGSGHGSFRTKGRYSAATVRGTKWLVQDSCAGTLTRVTRGVVAVRDNVRHKTITLRAGKHYLARPRR